MEEQEFKEMKIKIEGFKSELKSLIEKYNFGKTESDNYGGEEQYLSTDYYFTVNGNAWYAQNIQEILNESFGDY